MPSDNSGHVSSGSTGPVQIDYQSIPFCHCFPSRKFSAVKTQRESLSTSAAAAGQLGSERQTEVADVTVPMMGQNHFVDTKVPPHSTACHVTTINNVTHYANECQG